LRGGASYWHANLNVTLPIPKLSCPLIPAIALFNEVPMQNREANPCRIERPPAGIKTLKDSVKGAVVSGESFLVDNLASELVEKGMDADAAEAEAKVQAAKVFRSVAPAMRYLAEKANLYAVKPLLMFDVGRVGDAGLANQRSRVAIGGGIQVVIAVARFEAGYMRGVRRLPGDPRGNFIARLVFQNLF
jgi:hypothetical protein